MTVEATVVRAGRRFATATGVLRDAERPLLAYTADAARQSRRLSRCIVSTDD